MTLVVCLHLFGLTSAEGEEEADDSRWDFERNRSSDSANFHKSVVVKGIPKGVGEHVVIVYMEAISQVRCSSVNITGTVAMVQFQDYVGKWSRSY